MSRRRGRPRLCSDDLLLRVLDMRAASLSFRNIAAMLNAERVLTPAGRAHWCPSHVWRLVHTRSAEEIVRSA